MRCSAGYANKKYSEQREDAYYKTLSTQVGNACRAWLIKNDPQYMVGGMFQNFTQSKFGRKSKI